MLADLDYTSKYCFSNYASTSLLQVVVVDFAFQSCNDELPLRQDSPHFARRGGRGPSYPTDHLGV
jgi:hypothetical protein